MAIICGSDLSAASNGALDVACALASLRGDDEVILVHVVTTRDAELDHHRAQLEAQAERTSKPGLRVRVQLIPGSFENELVAFADTEGAELLVIARSNQPGPKFGTTAATIVAHSHVPVLCVADPAPWLAYAAKQKPVRILIGVDDSATCDLGMQWLHGLREQGPVEVVLGAVYYPDDATAHYGMRADTLVDRVPAVEAFINRDILRRFGGDGANVTSRAIRGLGRIGDHLIELAGAENVDAIVVGTGQKTGLGRLGSVSTVVVLESKRESVVCVPPQAHIPTLTVPAVQAALVATDLSSFANRAVAYAFGITPPTGTVHVVHVVKDDAEVDTAELERQLRALAPASARQTVVAHVVRGDDAAEALAQAAARTGVDVVCISSRGRSGITRALVGSVADRLLRATRLPVLVLRPA